MTIHIGKYNFDGPFTDTSKLKNQSGVYVILCSNGNSNWKVVDIGESQSVRERVENHDREDCWHRQCQSTLAVAVLYSNQKERMRIEQELRVQYKPPCGDQ